MGGGGDAKIHQFQVKTVGFAYQEEVGGFEIAVDNAVAMGKFKRPTKVVEDEVGFAFGEVSALEDAFERAAQEPFHDQAPAEVGVLLEVHDLDDVGVFEQAEQPRFAKKSTFHIVAFGNIWAELFEGKAPSNQGMFDLIDGTKCARADHGKDAVGADLIACFERAQTRAFFFCFVPCGTIRHCGRHSYKKADLHNRYARKLPIKSDLPSTF